MGKKDKSENAEQKQRVKRSPEELAEQYITKMEHCVQRLDMWYEKTLKGIKSRKHQLSEEQRTYVLQHIAEVNDAFFTSVAGTAKVDTKFKLK
jgi:predicted RNA-binding protein with RPS1 domain